MRNSDDQRTTLIAALIIFAILAAITFSVLTYEKTSTGAGYISIEDEDTALTARTILNFAGAGVACADDVDQTTCTIPGGGSTLGFESIIGTAGATATADVSNDLLSFLVAGSELSITTADDPETITFDLLANAGTDITADLEEETHASEHNVGGGDVVAFYATVQDEGTPLTARRVINFIGSGVSCADDAVDSTDCTITAGGDVTAVGSCLTGNCFTQASPDDFIDFSSQATETYNAGTLWYNSTDESLTFFNNEADISMDIGQETWVRVYNNTGVTIARGSAVYISGNHVGTQLPTIALAQGNNQTHAARFAGLTTHGIENATIGYVTAFGVVGGLNTSGFSNGDPLWVSTSAAGSLVNTKPEAPNFVIPVGIVTKANASTGRIFVSLPGEEHITAVENADVLVDAHAYIIDFSGDFIVTESPTDEVNVSLDINAGTDITADLEEETHASEHNVGGGDVVAFYATIQDEASSLTQRRTVNFTGAGVSCADNPGSSRTDCTIAGGGSGITVEEQDAGALTSITVVDFQAGFDISESPVGEANISFDITEVSLADDNIWLGSAGGLAVATALTDCDTNENYKFQYDTTTNAFSCNTTDMLTELELDSESELEGQLVGVTNVFTDVDTTWGTNVTFTAVIIVDGGSASLEIPNGAGGRTVDAAGEVTIDSTSETLNFHDGTEEKVLSPRLSKAIKIEDPTVADDFVIFRFDDTSNTSTMVLEEVCYLAVGGTNWVGQLQERDANGGTPTDTQSADTTATSGTNNCNTTFSNNSLDNGDWLGVDTASVSGSVAEINITFYYHIVP